MAQALIALGLAASLWAAHGAGLAAPDSVTAIHHAYVEAIEDAQKIELLTRLAQTPPQTQNEIQWLYDMFMRYPNMGTRQAVMDSLKKLGRGSQHLEPAFLFYLDQAEPEARLFGINGAFHIRAPSALPVIKKIARQKLQAKEVGELDLLSERNEWWVRYEALSVIAQWEGERAYELLEKQARRSPFVAKLMAQSLWQKSLPRFVAWAVSKDALDVQRAQLAFSAPVELEALRDTRAELKRFVYDVRADATARRSAAEKLGAAADAALAAELIAACEGGTAETRSLSLTAVMASSDPAATAYLQRAVREHASARVRLDALGSLALRLPAEAFRELAGAVAKSDPDPEVRQEASILLKRP